MASTRIAFHLENNNLENFTNLSETVNKSITVFEANLINNNNDNNSSSSIPPELLQITQRSINIIIVYSICFLIGAIGNGTIFTTIIRNKYSSRSRSSNQKRNFATTTNTNNNGSAHHQTTATIITTKSKCYSKITQLILNLSIADLIVTFFLIPYEIFTKVFIDWSAATATAGGNELCKICQFGRAFGLYLSSNIIICITLDRFMAIMYPLKNIDGSYGRIRMMLIISWIWAVVCSIPQLFVFSVQSHPIYPALKQCVSYGYFKNEEAEIMYSVSSLTMMYFLPFLIIITTYSTLLWKLVRKTQEHQQIIRTVSSSLSPSPSISLNPNGGHQAASPTIGGGGGPTPFALLKVNELLARIAKSNSGQKHQQLQNQLSSSSGLSRHDDDNIHGKTILTLRTSGNGISTYARARSRTFKLTLVIVITYLICSVPYVVMTLWYMFDRENASKFDARIQDGLFAMVVVNSCMNPLIYGSFSKNGSIPPPWWCRIYSYFSQRSEAAKSQQQPQRQAFPIRGNQHQDLSASSSSNSTSPLHQAYNKFLLELESS